MNNKKNIYLMYFIVLLQGFVFYAPIATIFRESRGISISEIFLIESISWILMIVFEVPWGIFADKFGYKKTLVIANLIFFISKIVFFKSDSFSMFLFERVLLSISIAGLSGCDSALLYLSIDKEDNSERVFAKYYNSMTIGFLMASIMSSFIISISMEATTFYTIIPYGLAFILSLFLDDIKSEIEKKPSIIESFKLVLGNKKFIIFIISFALISEVVQSITVFLNQGQYIKSGINIKFFGILLALMQVVKLLSVKSYKLSDKFGQTKSINLLVILITISSGTLIFVSNKLMSILIIGIISFSMALMEPIAMDIKNNIIESHDRATILSIYSMISSVITATINPIIGVAAEVSLEIGLVICCIIAITSSLLMGYFMKVNNK